MLEIKKARKHRALRAFNFERNHLCRDDKIRTCDPTPPRRVRYRAALHPALSKAANVNSFYKNQSILHQIFTPPHEAFSKACINSRQVFSL